MNITEFARLGGKARWKGKSKKQRSDIMRAIAKKPRKRGGNGGIWASSRELAGKRNMAVRLEYQTTDASYGEIGKKHGITRERVRQIISGRNSKQEVARRALRNAIRGGVIKRLPCEVCGDKAEGHHHLGYDEKHWLDVRWLCRKHHNMEHRSRWG